MKSEIKESKLWLELLMMLAIITAFAIGVFICPRTVLADEVKPQLNKTSIRLVKKKTFKLTVSGGNVVEWKSANHGIASVNKSGKVKAVSVGNTKITATTDSGDTLTCKVYVVKAATEEAVKAAEKYDYEIKPVLSPFVYFFTVKSDNPNTLNVIFCGKSPNGNKIKLVPVTRYFADINYYDRSRMQVAKNTYLYEQSGAYVPAKTDLTVYATDEKFQPDTIERPTIEYATSITTHPRTCWPSKKKVPYPEGNLCSMQKYLIQTYADPVDGDLFAKLDAVQKGLKDLSMYPKSINDKSIPTGKYPFLAASPYYEISLQKMSRDVYMPTTDSCFMEWINPYTLQSLQYPSVMGDVAKRLDRKCKVTSGDIHSRINVTKDGVTKSYGGAGTGSTDELYLDYVKNTIRFDDNGNLNLSLTDIRDKYMDCAKKSDEYTKQLNEPLSDDSIIKKIGNGSWLRLYAGNETYLSVLKLGNEGQFPTLRHFKHCWVDGRFINYVGVWERGAKFSEFGEADILLRNQTIHNNAGKTFVSDVYYSYDKNTDTWKPYYFNLPSLSRTEVEAMNVDRNTSTSLTGNGYAYDGDVAPGTRIKW